MINSPCTKVCNYIPNTDICSGCFRTTAEIASWPNITTDEKLAIKKAAQQRSMMRHSQQEVIAGALKQQEGQTPRGDSYQKLGY